MQTPLQKRIAARKKRIAARNGHPPSKETSSKETSQKKTRKEIKNEKIKEAKKILNDEATKDKVTIEICIHCYHYQHRLCWMLSSILQQKGDVPNILVNISYTPNNGNPTTEAVCEFFRKQGLNIKETIIRKEKVHNRAVARNKQVEETTSDWILFADSDMVYDPDFFDDLQKKLKSNLKAEVNVMGANRYSLNIPFCIKYFEEDKLEYPCVVEDVVSLVSSWPVMWFTGARVAAGNFQLANVKAIGIINNGKYVGRTRDHWRATSSDRGFRCGMGGRRGIKTKPQYHLNHDRGGPEIQR